MTEKELFEVWAESMANWDLHWSDVWEQYADHQTNAAWLAWQASANRKDYKLVPIEPTNEMIDSIYGEDGDYITTIDGSPESIYKAMIEAAQENKNAK